MIIKEIPARDTLQLRSKVLRSGKPISECVFEGDDSVGTRHFGAVDSNNNVVGIVSVYSKKTPLIDGGTCFQLRAMATSESCRGQGVGNRLLSAAEEYASQSGASFVWANARSSAIEFYIKAGYEIKSDEFMIDGIGPHYLVSKSFV
ncbi:GNAT family N-acetyltransferase [Aestuariicella sp. G3-2]|uniref:GNAT family N-acetyltransferase n=1 Tax=Pseudomaricurvus albidus TaxID=2842452 RepID=UPI001C0DD658|nr:GNAT family N-acetyltransferase [Aestuariicella albida]